MNFCTSYHNSHSLRSFDLKPISKGNIQKENLMTPEFITLTVQLISILHNPNIKIYKSNKHNKNNKNNKHNKHNKHNKRIDYSKYPISDRPHYQYKL